jgi:hypothetical protein
MAVVMEMQWAGVTPEQYQQIMEALELDGSPPAGGMLHAAGFDENGIRVVDVWESADHFHRFAEERLNAATQAAGVSGEPQVEFYEIHNSWTPKDGSGLDGVKATRAL